MKRFLYAALAGFSAITCCLTLLVPPAWAATAPPATQPGQALEISPPIITLTVNPGQTLKIPISLRDVSSGNLVVTGQVNDFVAAGEDGTPKILMDGTSDSPYSMSTWIAPMQNLLLKPQQIQKLTVTMHVPTSASPGGHYGVLRFTGTAPELQGTGVSLTASLGSLMLITVNGKVKEGLSVAEFSVNKDGKKGTFFEGAPLNFVERLNNTGNVHEEPTGQVVVTDLFGKRLAAVNVNLERHNILPQSIRLFTEPLDGSVLGNKMLFGRYIAKLNLTYGATTQQTLTAAFAFWVIPYRLIGAVLVSVVGGFFLLRFLIKRYNRYIISKVQNSQPPKPGP